MRQVIRQVQTFTYQGAGQYNVLIPRTGYLARLWIRFYGTLNNSGSSAGTVGWRAPWSLIQNARLNVNGNVFPLSMDGYSAELQARFMRPGYQDNSQMSVNAGNNTVEFTTMLPVTVTDANQTGIIWAGSDKVTIYLEINTRAADDPAFASPPSGDTLTLTGTFEVWAESFLFGAQETKPDLSTLHNVKVIRKNITSNGEIYVDLPTLNEVYLRITHIVENNNAPLDYTPGLRIEYQIEDYENPYTITDGEFRYMQAYQYLGKVPLSTGARVLDLYQTRSLRDVINATGLSLFQSKIVIPDSVTITQPANIYTILETLSPLQ
ncbi:hypothetical protein [Sulfobacillus thermosulfidooxidans]|uniref:hypothetical protein n=1 Tax=Sulfobacillus thermosulfidooxidans TaxID=28034 RepID=UPI0002F1CCEF|nr:hypothetical protein [Sulfobacillus thermosulfidooxidans]